MIGPNNKCIALNFYNYGIFTGKMQGGAAQACCCDAGPVHGHPEAAEAHARDNVC
jgi:hypothetical protein